MTAWLIALALLLLPLLGGAWLGARMNRRGAIAARPALSAVAVLAGSLALATPLVLLLRTVSAWDTLGCALRFGVAAALLLVWGGRVPWRKLGLALGLGLALFEVGARVLLPNVSDRVAPPPLDRPLVLSERERFPECMAIDPEEADHSFARRLSGQPTEGVVVVHVGDSLVAGLVDPAPGGAHSFVDMLDSRQPGVSHFNAGYRNTGTDFQFAVVHRLLRSELRPDVIVLYLFPNDAGDLDIPAPCCAGEPLLRYEPELGLRCERPDWRYPLRDLLIRAPEPYLLGRLATFSVGAAQVRQRLLEWRWTWERDAFLNTDEEAALEHMQRIVSAMAARVEAAGAELAVVVLPFRFEIEQVVDDGGRQPLPDSVGGPTHRRLLRLVRDAGLEPLDPWPLVFDAAEAGLPELWEAPDDLHFGPAGHDLLAGWLLSNLPVVD